MDIKHRLARPFPVKSIHWRVGSTTKDKTKGMALAYLDARDVMKRLDDVMGFDWQCEYPLSDNGLLICKLGLKIDGEWIWRSNGAGDTQVEAEKGKASDAFKRAAVLFGIGRYLYFLDSPWLPINQFRQFSKEDISKIQLPDWATPEGYDRRVGI